MTGAAKGIGGVVTEHLARDGAHVALIGRDEQALIEHAALVDEGTRTAGAWSRSATSPTRPR